MIELDKDIEDRYAYREFPDADRWMFNKLLLSEKLGHNCGPCGVPPTEPGEYVVRPIMNTAGMGIGGVFIAYCAEGEEPVYVPGYFWCEAFDGPHGYTNFTDDEPVDECFGYIEGNRLDFEWYKEGDEFKCPPLPDFLKGISKHLLVEWIGDKIIEVSPRHMPYTHGRDNSYYQRVFVKAPWGLDEEQVATFYWRCYAKGN